MSSTDTLTRQMHESRARRLIAAETRRSGRIFPTLRWPPR